MADTGGMLALVPRPQDATRLVVPGGDGVDELHTTIAYLGDDVTGWSEDQRETVLAAARQAAGAVGPIEATVMGKAVFNPNGDDDHDPAAVYLVTAPELMELRERLSTYDVSGFPVYLPHITATYCRKGDHAESGEDGDTGGATRSPGAGEALTRMTYTGPIVFDRLRVALAEENTYLPLTQEANLDSPGEPDPEDAETKDVETKRKVASEAGERRYGHPIGTELGQARNAAAAKAQDNPRARDQYETLVGANPRDYRAMLDDLSAADVKALAAIAYSFRSTNPTVVQARIAVAGALRRLGLDVNDYGGLGRSKSKSRGKGTPPRRRTRAGNGQAAQGVKLGSVSDAEWNRLRAAGWKGQAGDREERIYPPPGKALGDDDVEYKRHVSDAKRDELSKTPKAMDDGSYPIETVKDLENAVTAYGRAKDKAAAKAHIIRNAKRLGAMDKLPDDWQGEKTAMGDDVEVKRTTTKPWEKGKVQKQGHTLDKSDDGDSYVVKTIGDLAAAVKRAKGIKDPEQRDKVRAHLRKEATRLKAPNMIPKDWGSSGDKSNGDGKGNLAPPFKKKGEKDAWSDALTTDDWVWAQAIEAKVMSPNLSATRLRNWWAYNRRGRAKWKPGTPGDFKRLRTNLAKYVPAHMLNGLTANIHKLGTGSWPGRGRGHGGKAADDAGRETKGTTVLTPTDLATVDTWDNDDHGSTVLALDRYADMGEEITSEEAYEQALADDVDWELDLDGTPTRADDDSTDDEPEPESIEDVNPARDGLAAIGALFAGTADENDEDEPRSGGSGRRRAST